jgi:hypothetical protein
MGLFEFVLGGPHGILVRVGQHSQPMQKPALAAAAPLNIQSPTGLDRPVSPFAIMACRYRESTKKAASRKSEGRLKVGTRRIAAPSPSGRGGLLGRDLDRELYEFAMIHFGRLDHERASDRSHAQI